MRAVVDKKFAKQLGQRVRGAREKAGISLRELAKNTKLSPGHISEIEQGVSVPGADKIKKIATALKTSVDSLIPAA